MVKPAVLLIGGLDPQGCAGLAADIHTVNQHDCHALPLVTALTEQDSHGLSRLGAVSAEKLLTDFACIKADFEINAVKIGLIPNIDIAEAIQHILSELKDVPVVLDPVLAASSGGEGVSEAVSNFITEHLLSEISLLTPNLIEIKQLVADVTDLEQAANSLRQHGLNACLVKGGHATSVYATDYFVSETAHFYCYQNKWDTPNVRGTGCVLASSLACHLAAGQDMRDAVVLAKAYVSRGIRLAQQAGPYHVIHHSNEPLALVDLPKLCYQAELVGKQFDFAACPEQLGIYPVVNSSSWVKKLVDENIHTIQLRIKEQTEDFIRREIQTVVSSLADKKVAFFVNDYWQLAIEQGAYGVHLGQEDLHDAQLDAIAKAGLRLGVSTHSYWELARALAVNPSYIALGPIYETTSKQMPFSPQGEQRLKQWVELLADHYPLVAIGGIDLARAERLKQTGVGSVAMISAITQAADYQQATRALINCWQ